MSDTPSTAAKQNIETVLKQAQQNCRAEQWTEAIAALQTAIAQCQNCLESAHRSALGPNNQAATAEAQQVGTQQTAAVLHQAKGDLFSNQGDITAAIASYQKALALTPEAGETKKALGEAYLAEATLLQRSGNVAAATQSYLQALSQSPYLFTAYSRLRYNLLRYEIPRGDSLLKDVVEACQSILANHPSLRPAQITLGYALTKMNRLSDAIDCYRSMTGPPEEKQRRSPDFIVIGAEKSGTTSLHQYLKLHPQVVAPIEKEIDFFDIEYSCGIEWYLAHFPPASKKIGLQNESDQASLDRAVLSQTNWITGETSANYLYSDVAPERIFRHFPNIKLAVILRDPVDRTVSRYNMMVRNGSEKRSFQTAIAEEIACIEQATVDGEIAWNALNRCRHVGNSLYYHHLKRWLARFPRQQMLVLQSENLFAQPQTTMQQLYQMLGLTGDYPQPEYTQHNAGDYQPANEDARQLLADFFAPHTRQLETLLGQSFHWTSTPACTTP